MKGVGDWVSKTVFKYNKKGLIIKEVETLYTIMPDGKAIKTKKNIKITKYQYY